MNILCREMRRSLKELDLGLSGELQMSERMEELFNALYLGRVPVSWSKLAYPSQRSFSSWMDNLIARAGQLQSWVEEPASIPLVVQITYMFNPQSFLTAIMQKTAQKQKLELDKLVIQTDVTRKTVEQTDTRARDGAYIYGLYMEGARWNWNSGLMEESLPREMSFALPVVCARAVLVDKMEKNGVYRYETQAHTNTAGSDRATKQLQAIEAAVTAADADLGCSFGPVLTVPRPSLCSVLCQLPRVQDSASRRLVRVHGGPAHKGLHHQVGAGGCGARHGSRGISTRRPRASSCGHSFLCVACFPLLPCLLLNAVSIRSFADRRTSNNATLSILHSCVFAVDGVEVRRGARVTNPRQTLYMCGRRSCRDLIANALGLAGHGSVVWTARFRDT